MYSPGERKRCERLPSSRRALWYSCGPCWLRSRRGRAVARWFGPPRPWRHSGRWPPPWPCCSLRLQESGPGWWRTASRWRWASREFYICDAERDSTVMKWRLSTQDQDDRIRLTNVYQQPAASWTGSSPPPDVVVGQGVGRLAVHVGREAPSGLGGHRVVKRHVEEAEVRTLSGVSHQCGRLPRACVTGKTTKKEKKRKKNNIETRRGLQTELKTSCQFLSLGSILIQQTYLKSLYLGLAWTLVCGMPFQQWIKLHYDGSAADWLLSGRHTVGLNQKRKVALWCQSAKQNKRAETAALCWNYNTPCP